MSASPEKVYGLFPKLKTMENRVAGTLSGGEQQMLTVEERSWQSRMRSLG